MFFFEKKKKNSQFLSVFEKVNDVSYKNENLGREIVEKKEDPT